MCALEIVVSAARATSHFNGRELLIIVQVHELEGCNGNAW